MNVGLKFIFFRCPGLYFSPVSSSLGVMYIRGLGTGKFGLLGTGLNSDVKLDNVWILILIPVIFVNNLECGF